MKIIVSPSDIAGEIDVPSSKSSMQRACALALIRKGTTLIENPGDSNDDLAAIGIIKSLGASVDTIDGVMHVTSNGIHHASGIIHCGESGLSLRMFGIISALSNREITITASGSLLNRPVAPLYDILQKVGVQIKSAYGTFPIIIKGPLYADDLIIDGSESSQYLTGLLIAFAAVAKKPVTLTVSNLKSKPYIDLTLSMMRHFGYRVTNEAYQRFVIDPHQSQIAEVSYRVEADWSSGSFLMVAAAIAGKITLKGLDIHSTQADRAILDVLERANASVIGGNDLKITKNDLQAFEFDATECPDLFPSLAVLATCCNGSSKIKGVHRLKYKESNRAEAIIKEFAKLNVTVTLEDDCMLITGKQIVKGAKVFSHHDHRIAMALTVLALVADGKTEIDAAESVNKSYPRFYNDMQQLGSLIQIHDK